MANTAKLNRPRVYGAGLVALDVVITPDERPAHTYAGGTCGNVLTILSYLGWESFPIARLNADAMSARVLADLQRWKVRIDFAKLEPQVPAPVVVEWIRGSKGRKSGHRFGASAAPTSRPASDFGALCEAGCAISAVFRGSDGVGVVWRLGAAEVGLPGYPEFFEPTASDDIPEHEVEFGHFISPNASVSPDTAPQMHRPLSGSPPAPR
jgi:hypothetical protein